MKFKNDNEPIDPARVLILDDGEDILRVSSYDEKGTFQVTIDINDEAAFGLSRKKALKLAWAILDELDPHGLG